MFLRYAHQEEIARFHVKLEEKAQEIDALRETIDQEESEKERLYSSKEALRDELRAEREIKERAIDELQRMKMEFQRVSLEQDEKLETEAEASAVEDVAEVIAELPELSPRPIDDTESVRAEAREAEMARFRAALGSRREMRHKAISAVSSEIARLRAELIRERELREAAEQELATAQHAPLDKLIMDVASGSEEPPGQSTAATGSEEGCYKSVDTPSGPCQVISVSKTFIRLKDLILEKKSLQKELGRLKDLNGRLEKQLSSQESRLSLVSSELHKTWAVVARMKQQHRQLHTHEKILRYELQHKRKMLNELKQELEYCREKWQRARVKNTQSEADWRQLRNEFAARRQHLDSANNSAESGFSDDNEQSPSNQPSSPVAETRETEEGVNITPQEPPKEETNTWQETPADDLDCPASVSLLKQQLCTFSDNLDAINTELKTTTATEAIESIFSLPSIVLPRHFRYLEALDRCKARSLGDLRASSKTPPPLTSKVDDEKEKLDENEERQEVEDTKDSELNKKETEEFEKTVNEVEEEKTESRLDEAQDKIDLNVRPKDTRTPEEVLAARSARLKRLEEQCQQLFNKVTRTTHRSHALANRLDDLHEYYGPEASTSTTSNPNPEEKRTPSPTPTPTPISKPPPSPPPMPDELPVFKIPESPQPPPTDNDADDQ